MLLFCDANTRCFSDWFNTNLRKAAKSHLQNMLSVHRLFNFFSLYVIAKKQTQIYI